MNRTVLSINGVPIRLPAERWAHITEEHCELAGLREDILETVAHPTSIYAGKNGALLAVKEQEYGRFLLVVYREMDEDGFVITAFLTSKPRFLEQRKKLWPP